MYKYRVTKYNPNFRDKNGHYYNDEWTSVYDVIKSNGKYSLNGYMAIEGEYIKTINLLLEYINYNEIIFSSFEKGFSIEDIMMYQINYFENEDDYILNMYQNIYENMHIQRGKELICLIKMILREYLWGELSMGKNKIQFGYDYYMYFITEKDCFEFLEKNITKHMFIEKILN